MELNPPVKEWRAPSGSSYIGDRAVEAWGLVGDGKPGVPATQYARTVDGAVFIYRPFPGAWERVS